VLGGPAPAAAPRPDLLAVDHAAALAINRGLYRALARHGLTVELAIPERLWHLPGAPSAEPPAADDPPLHRHRFAGGNLRYPRIAGLGALLAARRPRLLHLNNEPDTPLAFRLGGWARRHAAALTAQSQESEFLPFWPTLRQGDLRQAARHLRTRLAALATRRRVDAVFCLSQRSQATWESLGFRQCLRLPLGFDPALFRPDPADRAAMRARLRVTAPVVAFFGRALPRKGPHLLVEALLRLANRPWHLLLDEAAPGDAYLGSLHRRLADAGLTGRVVAFRASHAEMPGYMRAADIVVVPSQWEEQYGRVAAEAMACGAAVVASPRGALPEILGEAGLLVPAEDTARLAATLAMLLADAGRRAALGCAAAARAAAALSLERQAEVMAAAFRRLLAPPPA